MSIRLAKKDEVFSPSYVATGEKVTASFGLKFNQDGERYILTSVFDFTNVSRQELMALAAKELVGDVGRKWRVLYASNRSEATTKNAFALMAVRGLLDAPTKRSSAPALVKARKLAKELKPEELQEVTAENIRSMSAEAKAAMLALLQAA